MATFQGGITIERIELENWKTHGSSRLEFKQGTNILIGQMGAGKSSVLDAISFALFGTFPSIQHRRVNVSDIIRSRPSQRESASVSLHFTIGPDKYSVKRSISRGGAAKATFEKNGSYLQSQPQRVNEEIEKVLKVDYDLFSKAIYSEQNGLDSFLNLTPTARKKQFDALLGLDKFAAAQENAGTVINRIKDMAEDGERTAKGLDIEGLREQLARLSEELERYEKEAAATAKELEKLESERRSNEKELGLLKAQYQKKLGLEQEISSYRSRIETLTGEIVKIDAMKVGDEKELASAKAALQKEAERARKEAKDALEAERKCQTTLSDATAGLSKLRKEKAEREKLLEEQGKSDRKQVEEKAAGLTARVEELRKEIASHSALRAESAKWIAELDKHIEKCPVCERGLEGPMRERLLNDKKRLVKELTEMSERMAKELDAAKKELEKENSLLNGLTVLEGRIRAYGDIESSMARLESECAKAREQLDAAKKARDSADETVAAKTEELNAISQKSEAAARRSGYIKQKEEAQSSLDRKAEEHRSIRVDQERLNGLQDSLTKTVAEMSRHSSALESQKKFVQDKKAQIKDKEEGIKKIEAIFADVKKKREVVEGLNRFRTSIQETQTMLRTQLIESINGIMNDVWPDLYPYGDYASVMLDATADDYVLKVKVNAGGESGWQDVEATASGGERSIACLAMRIAFSLVLAPNLRWLILDEPTHNIDQLGLERFIKMFNEVLPRLVEQTFIITHDPILKQASNAKVYMLKRNKSDHEETVIEEV